MTCAANLLRKLTEQRATQIETYRAARKARKASRAAGNAVIGITTHLLRAEQRARKRKSKPAQAGTSAPASLFERQEFHVG